MASKEKVPEKVQEAIFNKLLSRPADIECADCRNKAPTWVSLDFGVFVCIRCSGVHRQLGPHITRVRSTRLDGWTQENIDIMQAIGNKLANDFYEYRMPSGYRKPGANSSPEECRRFVDEKYIRKAFAPAGHQEPVKEYLSSKNKGTAADFSYSKGHQAQDRGDATKVVRKKSMSLDRLPPEHHHEQQSKKTQQQNQHHQQQQQHNNHHHQDLLTADDDLLGGGHDDGFGDFKQATQSASPIKKVEHLKKVHSEEQQHQWNWNFNANQGQNQQQHQNQNQNQNQNQGQNNFNNNNQQQQNMQNMQQQQQQKPAENKLDFMKLYSQPQAGHQAQGHQNHFMQMQNVQNPGWSAHHNTGWHSANHASNYGMPQQQNQFQGGFQQQQNFQQNQGFNQGFNQGMGYGNMGGNMQGNMGGMGQMGGMQNMGYGYGQGQGQMQGQMQQGQQFNNNAYGNNNNFAQMQMQGGNKFF